jgi:hypothetical protein
MIDLRQKMRRIIEARRRDCPDRYHDDDDNNRFPTFTSMKIYPVVSIGTRPPLVHVVAALTKSIASRILS